jgi:hypothetical protein
MMNQHVWIDKIGTTPLLHSMQFNNSKYLQHVFINTYKEVVVYVYIVCVLFDI